MKLNDRKKIILNIIRESRNTSSAFISYIAGYKDIQTASQFLIEFEKQGLIERAKETMDKPVRWYLTQAGKDYMDAHKL